MIIRHKVQIADKPAQYVARIKNAIVYVTVPRITFHGDMMHLITRQIEIRAIGTVFKLWELLADKKNQEAWQLIGEQINDIYLKGI
jgi:hypothetical protein